MAYLVQMRRQKLLNHSRRLDALAKRKQLHHDNSHKTTRVIGC